jgi:hypothetical protein
MMRDQESIERSRVESYRAIKNHHSTRVTIGGKTETPALKVDRSSRKSMRLRDGSNVITDDEI